MKIFNFIFIFALLISASFSVDHNDDKNMSAEEIESRKIHGFLKTNYVHSSFRYEEQRVTDEQGKYTIFGSIMISPEPIGDGSYGNVFVGIPKNFLNLNGEKIEKNVALKVFNKERSYENEIKILTRFNELTEEARMNIVEFLQAGYLVRQKKGYSLENRAYVMELGDCDLQGYLKNHCNGPECIGRVARGMALAMRDFHKLAIHFDLKPGNLVFVRDALKVVDFGMSKFIVSEDGTVEENLADVCLCIREQLTTRMYRSPENNILCDSDKVHWSNEVEVTKEHSGLMLSSKVDIWAIGVILVETMLYSNTLHLDMFYEHGGIVMCQPEQKSSPRCVKSRVSIANHLVLLFKFDTQGCLKRYENRYKTYSAYVLLLLQIMLIHPHIKELIMATLEYDPKDRPSARGILDYLDNKCQFKKSDPEKMPISIDEKIKNKLLEYLNNKKEIIINKQKVSLEDTNTKNKELNEITNKQKEGDNWEKKSNETIAGERQQQNEGGSSAGSGRKDKMELIEVMIAVLEKVNNFKNVDVGEPMKKPVEFCDTKNTDNSPELISLRAKIISEKEQEWKDELRKKLMEKQKEATKKMEYINPAGAKRGETSRNNSRQEPSSKKGKPDNKDSRQKAAAQNKNRNSSKRKGRR